METSRLTSWTNPGSTQMAINSHMSVRNAIKKANVFANVNLEIFLQGSYKNDTNIRGDSDVDVVVVAPDTFYHNLDKEDALRAHIGQPSISWEDLDILVRKALITQYGSTNVELKDKALKIKFNSNNYAPADVVVALGSREYSSFSDYIEGISFQNRRTGEMIINYPKQHYENGVIKSKATNGIFKSYVRLLKNARNFIIENSVPPKFEAPSYFIECLVHNLDDSDIKQNVRDFIKSAVGVWEYTDQNNDKCQNGITSMYGYEDTCWIHNSKVQFSAALRNMMNY